MRQRLYQMVKAQPNAPTVMIESHRKQQARDEEYNEKQLVIVQQQQAGEVKCEYKKLCSDDVDSDSADEKTFLALKERAA